MCGRPPPSTRLVPRPSAKRPRRPACAAAGGMPKRYCVVTGATAERVRSTVGRWGISVRRCRLVHVMCGAETIEVSTFRGAADAEAVEDGDHSTDEHGRILRDNVFGSMEEDARRRDFTVNAMFYDPVKGEVIDYHDGVADIKAKKLRMIGDPPPRYREDPIRMLRAVRLAAARGLDIETPARQPTKELAGLLPTAPTARRLAGLLDPFPSGLAPDGPGARRSGFASGRPWRANRRSC